MSEPIQRWPIKGLPPEPHGVITANKSARTVERYPYQMRKTQPQPIKNREHCSINPKGHFGKIIGHIFAVFSAAMAQAGGKRHNRDNPGENQTLRSAVSAAADSSTNGQAGDQSRRRRDDCGRPSASFRRWQAGSGYLGNYGKLIPGILVKSIERKQDVELVICAVSQH